MAKIRSHRDRVKKAKDVIKFDPKYNGHHISIRDRKAFVKFFLLEDIVELYEERLRSERIRPTTQARADKIGTRQNIEKFQAIIKVVNNSVGAARAAISSGNYKKVWKAIPEGALMAAAANCVERLSKMQKLTMKILEKLSDETIKALDIDKKDENDLDDLEEHEKHVRIAKDLPPQLDEIAEVERAAEVDIPDRKRSGKVDPNT